jgi:hypothetical protein
LSTRFRRNRLVAFVAAIALIACAAVYSAHSIGDRVHELGHCDLCLHFSGTAGSPAQATAVGKPVLVVRVPVERPATILPAWRKSSNQLARGPPLLQAV